MVLGAAVTLGWFFLQGFERAFEEVPAHADGAVAGEQGQGGGVVSGNGDVNGDGGRDLSDAIYLLSFLFQGGPAPLPCPSAGGGAGGAGDAGGGGGPVDNPLPPTGQTLCYDELGAVTDCATGDCLGQDGFYQAGCALTGAARFDDNLDGTVTDNCTGLMWQQDTADTDNDGGTTHSECLAGGEPGMQPPTSCAKSTWTDIVVQGDDIPWCQALDYCENLDFATHDDWRLPNIQELLSIVDYSLTGPAIDTSFFGLSVPPAPPPNASELFYWSSTNAEDGNGFAPYALQVDFSRGNSSNYPRNNLQYVRAVRSVSLAGGGAGLADDPGRGAGILGNGDVNGDLSLDLSDAIFLLAFLFQGGDAPEACAGVALETDCGNGIDDDLDGDTDCDDPDCTGDLSCPPTETICDDGVDNDFDGDIDCADSDCFVVQPEDPSLLPDTGVTLCSQLIRHQPVDCAVAECEDAPCGETAPAGQDGFYETGCASDGTRFTDNLDGTVTDNCTGLMWQKDTADTDGIGGVDNADKLSWCAALAYCEVSLDGFATHTDWRLPNIREIQSIVDHTGVQTLGVFPPFSQAPRVDGDPPTRYWSSTSRVGAPAHAWLVEITGVPYVGWDNPVTALHFVRGVRDAP